MNRKVLSQNGLIHIKSGGRMMIDTSDSHSRKYMCVNPFRCFNNNIENSNKSIMMSNDINRKFNQNR